MPARKPHKNLANLGLAAGQAEELLGDVKRAVETSGRAERIVAIPLSQIKPDRYQAREILPPEIKEAFYKGEIDCYDAAKLLINAAEGDDGLHAQVESLRSLGASIHKDGQISPARGKWVSTGSGPYFLLESGERRFWSLALKSLETNLQNEPRLKVVEQKDTSRVGQVSENLQREDLCAVDLSKAIATLVLALQGIEPAPGQDQMDYCRQALHIRVSRGIWPEVKQIVKLDRTYLFRLLQILNLDDQLLRLACDYRLEEFRLREIVAAPEENRHRMILGVINEKLTRADLARLAEKTQADAEGGRSGKTVTAPGPHRKLASRVKSIFNFVGRSDFDQDFDEVSTELVTLLRNPHEDLEKAADYLEALADSMRRIRSRL